MWKQFRAIMNWYAQQNDESKRAWYPTLPTIAENEQPWFTQDEVRCIVKAAQGQYKVLFHLAAYSGLRSGELAGLHVQDLGFARGVIRVRRSVWKGMEVAPKTGCVDRFNYRSDAHGTSWRPHCWAYLPIKGWHSPGEPGHLQAGSETALQEVRDSVRGIHAFRYGRVSQLQANGVPADFTKSQVGHSSLKLMFCTQPA